MSMHINLKHIKRFKAHLIKNLANNIQSELRDWAAFHENGRIKLGWKRIAIGYSRRIDFEPLSTLKIIRRKADKWLKDF